jgi:hypothetical protein
MQLGGGSVGTDVRAHDEARVDHVGNEDLGAHPGLVAHLVDRIIMRPISSKYLCPVDKR